MIGVEEFIYNETLNGGLTPATFSLAPRVPTENTEKLYELIEKFTYRYLLL